MIHVYNENSCFNVRSSISSVTIPSRLVKHKVQIPFFVTFYLFYRVIFKNSFLSRPLPSRGWTEIYGSTVPTVWGHIYFTLRYSSVLAGIYTAYTNYPVLNTESITFYILVTLFKRCVYVPSCGNLNPLGHINAHDSWILPEQF